MISRQSQRVATVAHVLGDRHDVIEWSVDTLGPSRRSQLVQILNWPTFSIILETAAGNDRI